MLFCKLEIYIKNEVFVLHNNSVSKLNASFHKNIVNKVLYLIRRTWTKGQDPSEYSGESFGTSGPFVIV